MSKKQRIALIIGIWAVAIGAVGAPAFNLFPNISPVTSNGDIGSTTARWRRIHTQFASTTEIDFASGSATSTLRSSATSSLATGINLLNGCFAVNGTCVGGGGGGSGITSLNGLSGSSQTFTAQGNIAISSAGTAHAFNASTSPGFGFFNATSTNSLNDIYGSLNVRNGATTTNFYASASSTIAGALNVSGASNLSNGLTVLGSLSLPAGSVTNAMLQNSAISGISLGGTLGALTATNGTLTFSGSYDGSTARTVGLNLSSENTWTAAQRFDAGATTTNLYSSASSTIGGALNVSGNGIFNSNVGIGTTSPLELFSIEGDLYDNVRDIGGVLFTGTDTVGSWLTLEARNGGRRWSVASVGSASGIGGGKFAIYDADPSVGTYRLVINTSGLVGIGSTSPVSLLTLENLTGPALALSRNDTTLTANDELGRINFWGKDTSSQGIFASISGTAQGTTNNFGNLRFYTASLASDLSEKMRIISSGNVGIGSTSPDSLLSVQGNSLTSGTSTVMGLFATSTIMLSNTFSVQSDGHIAVTSSATSTFSNGLSVATSNNGFTVGTTTLNGKVSFDGEITLNEFRIGNCTGSVTVNWSNGNKQVCTLTGNVTSVTFNQGEPGTAYRLALCQDGTGGRTATGWAGSISFVTGDLSNATNSPGMTTKLGTCNIFSFETSSATGTIKYFGTLPLKSN